MGRRKIQIVPIQATRALQQTRLKRTGGIFKKAYELSILCQKAVNVCICVEDKKTGRQQVYSSNVSFRPDLSRLEVRMFSNEDREVLLIVRWTAERDQGTPQLDTKAQCPHRCINSGRSADDANAVGITK